MKTISIIGCGWLGLSPGERFVSEGFEVKGSTTKISKLESLASVGISPFHMELRPEIWGNTNDFFNSDILIVNLPPRNRNGADFFCK